MECKFFSRVPVNTHNLEIIETYWNVNKAVTSVPMPTVAEIIETYWNVKLKNMTRKKQKHYEIIETYWNVKSTPSALTYLLCIEIIEKHIGM